jgi:hypothetical protein
LKISQTLSHAPGDLEICGQAEDCINCRIVHLYNHDRKNMASQTVNYSTLLLAGSGGYIESKSKDIVHLGYPTYLDI